jgi:hypothetical protein
LGEISPDEFKHFIGPDIRLEPVMITKDAKVHDLLGFYMGKNTPERQDFIIGNLKVEKDLVKGGFSTGCPLSFRRLSPVLLGTELQYFGYDYPRGRGARHGIAKSAEADAGVSCLQKGEFPYRFRKSTLAGIAA